MCSCTGGSRFEQDCEYLRLSYSGLRRQSITRPPNDSQSFSLTSITITVNCSIEMLSPRDYAEYVTSGTELFHASIFLEALLRSHLVTKVCSFFREDIHQAYQTNNTQNSRLNLNILFITPHLNVVLPSCRSETYR